MRDSERTSGLGPSDKAEAKPSRTTRKPEDIRRQARDGIGNSEKAPGKDSDYLSHRGKYGAHKAVKHTTKGSK